MFFIFQSQLLLLIPKSPAPTLKERGKWSNELNDFVEQCLEKSPSIRPSAEKLLKVFFIFNFN